MSRLPISGGDNGTWGDILNDFLAQEHNADGSQKTLPVSKGGTGAKDAGTALTNLGAVPGTDSRLSDERVPTDGSVTDAKVAGGGLSPSSVAGTAVITADSRLSDARTPLAHKSTHASGGSDALAPVDIGAISKATASYIISISGSTTSAMNGLTGATDFSGSDPAAVLQSCITALKSSAGNAVGEILFAPGAYTWGSVPRIPPVPVGNTPDPGMLAIKGAGKFGAGAKVTLSSNGSRFLDLGRTADYDTFTNVELSDLLIDCNNVDPATTTIQHVIVGTRGGAGGVQLDQRINIAQFTVRNVRAINIPTSTHGRVAIALSSRQLNVNEATQTSVTGVLLENVEAYGGPNGFGISGANSPGNATNVLIDDIRIVGCRHLIPAYTSVTSSFHILVGQWAHIGSVTIRDFKGTFSGDVGIELDNCTDATVEDALVENARSVAFYATNFQPPLYPGEQRIVWRRCHSRITDATTSAVQIFSGFRADDGGGAGALGSFEMYDCSYYRNTVDVSPTFGEALEVSSGTVLGKLIVRNFNIDIDGINYAGAGNVQTIVTRVWPLAATPTCVVDISGLYLRLRGTRGGAGTVTAKMLMLNGSITLKLDDYLIDSVVTGIQNNGERAVGLGENASVIHGTISRLKVLQFTGAQGWVILINPAAQLTITPALDIVDCDFSQLPAGATEVFHVDNTNQAKVFYKGNKWRTFPKVRQVMGAGNFAAATFTTTVGNQYIGGDPATIWFGVGSGSGITTIDLSKDGTNYDNVYTQASGAMAQSVYVPVDNGDYIKVTFATTQPSTRVMFHS
jgi:hypothetical protein